jgi:AAA+ ATPase superfamily predicted ATPase
MGRKRELQRLESLYRSPKGGLLNLYGRRRIGKTRLITHFLDRHNENRDFYWVATTHSEAFQLRDFSQAILHHDPRMTGPPTEEFTFSGFWGLILSRYDRFWSMLLTFYLEERRHQVFKTENVERDTATQSTNDLRCLIFGLTNPLIAFGHL